MSYYSNIEQIKSTLEGYTPKTFKNKQDFLNTVGEFVFNLHQQGADIELIKDYDEWLEAYEAETFTTDMLCNGYDWEEIDHHSVQKLGYDNKGDGNPMEYVYALFDNENKEYILLKITGWYSSWDSSDFEDIFPVVYQEEIIATFPNQLGD